MYKPVWIGIVCLSLILLSSKSIADSETEHHYTYGAVIETGPIPELRFPIEKMSQKWKEMGLSEDSIERNKKSLEREQDKVRAGTKLKIFVDVLYASETLSLQRQPENSIRPEQKSREVLNRQAYGFFAGSNQSVSELAEGSISSVDFYENSASQRPPNHWLPHTIGHRFATVLLGYQTIAEAMKLAEKVSANQTETVFKEGDYIWTVSGPSLDRFTQIEWRKGSLGSKPGITLKVDKWLDTKPLAVAAQFIILQHDSKGSVSNSREFTLTSAKTDKDADYKRPFEVWPTGSLVVDNRSGKSSSYFLEGKLPPIEFADQHLIPDNLPAKVVKKENDITVGWIAFGVIGLTLIGGTILIVRRNSVKK